MFPVVSIYPACCRSVDNLPYCIIVQLSDDDVGDAAERCSMSKFDYEDDGEFKSADEYAKDFEPQDGVDYEWVFDYAQDCYQRVVDAKDRIEKKADAIVNYFGAFGGLLMLVFVYTAQAAHWSVALAILPTLTFCVIAMREAICARAPMTVPAPPEVRNAIDFANAYGDNAKATFVPRFAAAAIGMEAVNNEKSRLVNSASRYLLWAMGLLSLPLLAEIVQSVL